MAEREILVGTADGTMRVFVAHPDGGGAYPVAVLYMDGVGYRDQIKENARRFAASGYFCVAPDLYYRAGQYLSFDFSKIASEGMGGEEGKRLMAAASSVTPERAMEDTRTILNEIASDPAAARGAKVCVGYCMGARIALRAASELADEFVAAAGIHPGALVTDKPDSPHLDLARVRGELYYAFAEIDRSATPELVDRFRDELHRNGVRGVVERIPGVAQGFAMADLAVYNRDASEHHYDRTLDLWRRNLSREPART
ncbi:MAG TPA: dienelactone hydrolase family protein [Candidatus Acidoferrum sp.]|nr:dienelactone hydrolase family protein [Candidatus Acidoferrum sp.]